MKYLSILFFLFLLLLNIQPLSAQNDKFIEITSTDTITLKPIEFTYEISSGNNSFSFNFKDRDTAQTVVQLIEIENLLSKNKFSFKVEDKSSYTISPNNKPDTVITLNLNSESELKRLHNLLMKVQGISGKISDAKFESFSTCKAEIYKRLYAKALEDANDLAKISGNSIGQLISVHEPQPDLFSGMIDSYKKMFSSSTLFSKMFGFESGLAQQVEKKLVFRFQLK